MSNNAVSHKSSSKLAKLSGVQIPEGALYTEAFDLLCQRFRINADKCFRDDKKAKIFKAFMTRVFSGQQADFPEICRDYFVKHKKTNWRKIVIKQAKAESRERLFRSYTDPMSALVADPVHKRVICGLPASKFYKTPEWRRLRYLALKSLGRGFKSLLSHQN